MHSTTHHIVRIHRSAYPDLEQLLETQQLRGVSGRLQHDGFNGTLYRPVSELLAPLNDGQFQIRETIIEAALHRLPSAEYSALMTRPGVGIPTDLNALSSALRATSTAGQARQLLENCQPHGSDAPLPPQLVYPTRFQAAWLPHLTLVARKQNEWFLILFFDLTVLDLGRQLMQNDVAIDIGLSPLLNAYVVTTDQDVRVDSPVPAHLRELMYDLTGQERQLLQRILHAWHRARLERFLNWLTLTAAQVFVEELTYADLNKGFLRTAREYGIIDYHEAWLHQRLQACQIPFTRVWPNGTSQQCHQCAEPYGQRNGDCFQCLACGLTMDAHQNAARNIATRGYQKQLQRRVN